VVKPCRLSPLSTGGSTSLSTYNQNDLRVSKTVGGTQTTYLLDGDSVVRESKAGVNTDLLQGPGVDNLLERGGVWFTPNSLGGTATTVDGSGNWLQRYDYAPFGQLTLTGGGTAQPYQFTGREADESGLMSYRARYYNPNWGRFVSEDPIGVDGAAELASGSIVTEGSGFAAWLKPEGAEPAPGGHLAGGDNGEASGAAALWGLGVHPAGPAWTIAPYAYVGDNPASSRDPSGLGAPWYVKAILALRVLVEAPIRIITGSGTGGGRGPLVIRPDRVNPPGASVSAGGGGGGGGGPLQFEEAAASLRARWLSWPTGAASRSRR
jgi:RHS repeat-associated protein